MAFAVGDLSRWTGERSRGGVDFAPSEGDRRETEDGGTGGKSDAAGDGAGDAVWGRDSTDLQND